MPTYWDTDNCPEGTKIYSSHGNEISMVQSVEFEENTEEKRGIARLEIVMTDDAGYVLIASDAKSAALIYPKVWCEIVFPGDKPLSSFPVTAWEKTITVQVADWQESNPKPVIVEPSSK